MPPYNDKYGGLVRLTELPIRLFGAIIVELLWQMMLTCILLAVGGTKLLVEISTQVGVPVLPAVDAVAITGEVGILLPVATFG